MKGAPLKAEGGSGGERQARVQTVWSPPAKRWGAWRTVAVVGGGVACEERPGRRDGVKMSALGKLLAQASGF